MVRCVGLVWFVRLGWSGRVYQVLSSLQALVAWVSLVCMVELRWISRFLVKMVGSVRLVRLGLVGWIGLDRYSQVGRSSEVG